MAATTCICGFVSKSRSGDKHHAAACPVEQARSAAFLKAIEDRRPEDAWRDGYAAAAKVKAEAR